MDALDIARATALAIALTWLPGALVLAAARVRPLTTWVGAPPVTLALVYVGTAAARFLGIAWSVWVLLATAAVVAAVLVGVRRLTPRSWTVADPVQAAGPRWGVAGTIFVVGLGIVALAVGVWIYVTVSDRFTIVPQDFDAAFQANAVRFVAETGDGSPQGLRDVNSWGSSTPYFYPAAYHALVALVDGASGLGVIAAIHATAVTWFVAILLGLVGLLRQLRLGAFGTGVALLVATSFTSYPYELMWRGLFPFIQSLVMVVPTLVLLMEGVKRRTLATGAATALAAVGVVAVHTSGATTLVLLGGPLVVALLVRYRADLRRVLLWLGWTAALVVLMLVPTVLAVSQISGSLAFDWPALKSVPDGIRAALLFGTGYRDDAQVVLAALVLPGALLALRRRHSPAWAFTVSMAAAMVLFVLAVSVDNRLSSLLTGFWWNDQLRLSALVAVLAPVFVAVLGDDVAELCGRVWARFGWPVPQPPLVRASIAVVAAVALSVAYLAVAGRGYVDRNWWAVAYRYTHGPVVSPEKMEAMEELATLVEPGERVMNDNVDGSVWMYALDGVTPVAGHYQRDTTNAPQRLLLDHFDEIAEDPAVQAAVRDLGIRYVVVMDGSIMEQWDRSTGLDEIADQPEVFHEVFSNSDAAIYEIDPSLSGSD